MMPLLGEANTNTLDPPGRWRLLGVGVVVGLICFLVWWFIPLDFYVFYSIVRPQLASPHWAPKLQVAAALPLTVIVWLAVELFQRSRRGQVLSLRWVMKFPLAFLATLLISSIILVGHVAEQPEPGELYNPVSAVPNFKWYRDNNGRIKLCFAWWKIGPLGEPLQNLTPKIAQEWDRQQHESPPSTAQTRLPIAPVQNQTSPLARNQAATPAAADSPVDASSARPERSFTEDHTQVAGGFRFELKGCHKQPADKLFCDLLITNLEEDGPLNLVAGPDRNGYDYPISRIVDDHGNVYLSYLTQLAEAKGTHGGGGPYAVSSIAKSVLTSGVPVAARVGFSAVRVQTTALALLELVYVTGRWGLGGMKVGKVQFRQIPTAFGKTTSALGNPQGGS